MNFRDGTEVTAYYTDNLEEAVNTAVEMARKRAVSSDYRTDGTGGDRARCVIDTMFMQGGE